MKIDKKAMGAFIAGGIFGILFILLILLVSAADVAAIGPEGSEIGLSSVNGYLRDLIGRSELWYDITELLGYGALASAAVFALLGVWQLIRRRSLSKIDTELYVLAAFYVAVLAVYLLFEAVVINYRPILADGLLEASFPSSHTMLALCFFGGAAHQIWIRTGHKVIKHISSAAVAICGLAVAVGRLLSGVHWFTDILGGLLISGCLISVYIGACRAVGQKKV